NMPHPPDHPIFWSFFLQHGVIVATALFLPLALKWRPNRGSFWRVQLWSQLYFFSALGLNFLLGTNFGFLRAKPQQASILDHFGPWPQYLIAIQLFALLAYLLLLLPFAKRLRQRK
ncbi:MAG: TIGR02206 family membrane protein, partial [Verrucomicrobiales bacterium]